MKWLNLIIEKKHIAIASLAVLLGAAAAINFAVASSRKKSENNDLTAVNGTANYGDAEYVANTDTSGDAYFAQARLDKQQSRGEAAEVLAAMYSGGDMTSDELSVVTENAKNLSELIESEGKIETLLKAQGFSDALCYLSDNGANVIVKTDGLDAASAAKIKSTLQSEAQVAADAITIVEVH